MNWCFGTDFGFDLIWVTLWLRWMKTFLVIIVETFNRFSHKKLIGESVDHSHGSIFSLIYVHMSTSQSTSSTPQHRTDITGEYKNNKNKVLVVVNEKSNQNVCENKITKYYTIREWMVVSCDASKYLNFMENRMWKMIIALFNVQRLERFPLHLC